MVEFNITFHFDGDESEKPLIKSIVMKSFVKAYKDRKIRSFISERAD